MPETSLKVEAHETHEGFVCVSLDSDEGEHARGIIDRDHALLIAIDLIISCTTLSRHEVITYLQELGD